MKQKSHSGLKKRIKIRKSGAIFVKKAAKRHLLVNKSKRQKKSNPNGMPYERTHIQAARRLMPGKVVLRLGRKKK